MTQEELDRLMNGDFDDEVESAGDNNGTHETHTTSDEFDEIANLNNYDISPTKSWPPPPPLTENKVVHQLDDVTKESEEKATQIFDMLEHISNDSMESEIPMGQITDTLNSVSELLMKLSEKFPNFEVFKTENEKIQNALASAEDVNMRLSNIGMNTLSAMDMMQYQDIHRQKIERVINIMRALSNYMNKLFEIFVFGNFF